MRREARSFVIQEGRKRTRQGFDNIFCLKISCPSDKARMTLSSTGERDNHRTGHITKKQMAILMTYDL
jgi:hypothetical protein